MALGLAFATTLSACALFATRPVQEMNDTSAALRAAREVQADVFAPELYRQANEWFYRAKREYKFRNFKDARAYSAKARAFAEQAEFESIRNGGNRTGGDAPSDPMGLPPPPPSSDGAAPDETAPPPPPPTAPTAPSKS